MTVIACKVDNGIIEIATDSITVRGYTQSRGKNTSHSKLFTINGITVGGTGKASESFLFETFLATHLPKKNTVDSILELKVAFSDWHDKKVGEKISNDYIIVYKGKAYVTESFFVEEIVTYEAIGAGMDFALTAMYLGHSATKAVEAAIELSIYCEHPVKSHTEKAK